MTEKEFIYTYMPLSDGLYRVAYYILESSDDAEDAVQDLYVKLWKSVGTLDTVYNPKAYCTTLLKNICLDRLRRASKTQHGDVPDSIPSSSDIHGTISAKEDLSRTVEAIARLPEKQRTVLKMKVMEDLSYEEIEQRTGMNYLTLRVLLSQARKRIKTTYYEND